MKLEAAVSRVGAEIRAELEQAGEFDPAVVERMSDAAESVVSLVVLELFGDPRADQVGRLVDARMRALRESAGHGCSQAAARATRCALFEVVERVVTRSVAL